ncbi:MAG TPA: kelch repeat-containing protein [Candidatus Sulfotelmatobacter sp.]|nr:kelch repeat-containing protein [Candidatus Sulfotelmatobacter sp.]
MRLRTFMPLLLLALLACHAAPQNKSHGPRPQLPVGKLAPGPDMTVARGGHTASVLQDFRILIAGGKDAHGKVLASTEIYDPNKQTFTPAGKMNTPRQGHIAAVLSDSKILIAGGASPAGALASSEDYDYETGKFTPRGNMHARRVGAAVTVLRDGSPLVTGGTDGVQSLDSAETYSVLTGKWSPVGKMSSARVEHTSTLLADGRVLITGGANPKQGILATAEIFDPKTNQFTRTGDMHQARFEHAAVLLPNGKVLIAGGTSRPDGTGALNSAELYDPATETFTVTGNLNEARNKLPDGYVLLDNRALMLGGAVSAEIFDPRSAAFRPVDGALDTARYNSAATQLMDGSVRIFGGYDASGVSTAKSWIYQP